MVALQREPRPRHSTTHHCGSATILRTRAHALAQLAPPGACTQRPLGAPGQAGPAHALLARPARAPPHALHPRGPFSRLVVASLPCSASPLSRFPYRPPLCPAAIPPLRPRCNAHRHRCWWGFWASGCGCSGNSGCGWGCHRAEFGVGGSGGDSGCGRARMGIVMAFNDVGGFVDVDYGSDLTDTEVEEEYAFTPRAFEPVVPRSSKRTYGVFVDGEAVLEGRKRSRVDEQLELLRAAIPNLCTDEKTSILRGAYEYIEKLQRQVQELHSELDSDSCFSDDESCCSDDGSCCSDDDDVDVSSCEDDLSTEERLVYSNVAVLGASRAECSGCSHFTVEVVGNEEGFKIHIECERRPRVLADIMEMLESSGMSVEQVSIAYREDSQFVFDCLGSEIDGNVIVPDARYVEACLRSLIADDRGVACAQ